MAARWLRPYSPSATQLVVLETPESTLVLLDGHSVCPAFNPIYDRQGMPVVLTALAVPVQLRINHATIFVNDHD